MIASSLDHAVGIASGLDLQRVPAETVRQVGHVIADTVAVSRGGAREDEIVQLVALAEADGSVGAAGEAARFSGTALRASTVLSSPLLRSSPGTAAFLNATAGSFLEMDEGMRPTGHPGMHIVPAALAVAEQVGAPGSALLRAVLVGYETTSRLFRAFRLQYPVHPHGHFGAVGSAVAVATLTGANPIEAARIAATTPILSIWDACYEGATARNTWMGLAAQSAVRATALAAAGFAGSSTALEIGFGRIAGELVDANVLEAPLSYDNLGIDNNYFKLHSACALSHAALDAIAKLDLPRPEDILQLTVETVSNNMKLNRLPQPNSLSTRFSLPYAVATAATLRRSDPDAFAFRPEVAELATRVTVSVADDLERQWPGASPARVTVYWDGGSATAEVANPHGFHADPISADELRAKFDQLVDEPRIAGDWWEKLTHLHDVENCSSLFVEES
jgi:2-methylcitrate dehydratase PrpD